jgi:hypothetical protein
MTTLRQAYLLLLLAVAAGSCRNRERREPIDAQHGLVLSLRMAEARVPQKHFAIVEVTLTNNGLVDLWINTRLLLDRYSAPASERELWFFVTGPQKRPLELECTNDSRPANSRDYRVLKPSEHITKTEILNGCFRIERSGAYTLGAFYQDGNPDPPPAPRGATYVSQLVQSQPVTFEILGGASGPTE